MPRPITLALSATLALAGLTATACGNEDDADRVRAALGRYFSALGNGDGKQACSMLTSNGRRSLLENRMLVVDDCEDALEWEVALWPSAERIAVKKIAARKVSIRGDRATVRDEDVRLPSAIADADARDEHPIVLRRTPSGWKIEDVG